MTVDTVDELVAAWTADMHDASKDETAREKWLREQLAAERKRREDAERELARVQTLPEMEWARVTAEITSALARVEHPVATRLMSTLDKGKVYVERLRDRAEKAERERDEHRKTRRDLESIVADVLVALDGEPDDSAVGLARARMGDLKRLEADNAALLEALREAVDRLGEIEPRLPGLVHNKECQSGDESWAAECDCSLAEWKRAAIVEHPGTAMLERMRVLERLAQRAVDDPGCMDEHWFADIERALKPETK